MNGSGASEGKGAGQARGARRRSRRHSQAERMALIARVGQRIAARRDPDELFATTCAELHWRLGYQHTAICVAVGARLLVATRPGHGTRITLSWPDASFQGCVP